MAIFEQDKVLYEEASNGDKTIIMPVTRANNVEGLGRSANTKFVAGEVVYVDNNKKIALKCIVGGTTGTGELDVSSKAIGETVKDGSVTWQVYNRTSNVTSVNGKTGDVTVGKIVDASISGKEITLTFADGTTKTLTTQDTNTNNISASSVGNTSGYTKLSNGMIMQYGELTMTANAATVTLPTPMATATYAALVTQANNKSWEQNMKVTARSKTSFTINTYSTFNDKVTWAVIGK